MKRDSPVDSLRFSGRVFSQPELAIIRAWLAQNTLCREHLARRVCQEFGWFNAAGNPQTMSCKVTLLRMHRAGLIELPAPAHPDTNHRKGKPDVRSAQGTGIPAPFPSQLAMDAEQVRQVRLEVVQTAAGRAIYHQLLRDHHYLGAGSMAGAQLRYLARGGGGEVVGAFGFGAGAWLVAGRDRFIGWSDTSRRANLHRVVNNNRFQIPPVGACSQPCLPPTFPRRPAHRCGLALALRLQPRIARDFRGVGALHGHLLSGGQLDRSRHYQGPRKTRKEPPASPPTQERPGLAPPKELPRHPRPLSPEPGGTEYLRFDRSWVTR